jgi:CPA2 family monovalent cation:H+ antiporter-2
MPHPLIATIVVGIVLAYVLGAVANRFRVSPLVGYLLAGVAVGPHTPGFVADLSLATELSEIGIILLMFGVGLHFSLAKLLSVRAIAIPGAIIQIAIAIAMGMGLAALLGWDAGASFVFGLALSVASTVVLLRALADRHLLETERGHIAVGWLIVEDLAMVLALVLLPPLAGLLRGDTSGSSASIAFAIGVTVLKVAVFVALMLLVGRRAIPWLLHQAARAGSRELFRLSVLAIALGVAYFASELFGVSFALGAFFAGMVMSESALSQEAAEQTLPLRDAFAVLFFVSVGMLFDPAILVDAPLLLLATVLIVVVGKSAAALLIVLAFRYPLGTALTISASLAQIGEFSFILVGLGVSLHLLPDQGRDLVLAGAMISILLNPLWFAAIDRLKPWLDRRGQPMGSGTEDAAITPSIATGHAILIGHGRVGGAIAESWRARFGPIVVIEADDAIIEKLRADGVEAFAAGETPEIVLRTANVGNAKILFVAIPNSFEAGQFVEKARAENSNLVILARAHSDAEVEYLQKLGADEAVMGERELANAMLSRAATRAI